MRAISQNLKSLKIDENTVSETGILRIEDVNDNEQKRLLAIDIKNLFLIALGRRIIFDRQEYWIGNLVEIEEKAMANSPNQGDKIVPDFEISN